MTQKITDATRQEILEWFDRIIDQHEELFYLHLIKAAKQILMNVEIVDDKPILKEDDVVMIEHTHGYKHVGRIKLLHKYGNPDVIAVHGGLIGYDTKKDIVKSIFARNSGTVCIHERLVNGS